MTRKQITSLLLLGASIIYDVIPADFIPDIPFVGWLDDMLVTSSAALNCLQQFGVNANGKVAQMDMHTPCNPRHHSRDSACRNHCRYGE